ncbi:hypothetical protein [Miniphocaeibacter massiliensis]|uniref:hypothetical protein n=1 Tax=Miniphocaeibacter massiliensis TaxID=2041841 RepID=UPI000C08D423|nr:hypothetical protein [Miniphocaeibacter massiliensis]
MKLQYILNFFIFVVLLFFVNKTLEIVKLFTKNDNIALAVIIVVYIIILFISTKIIKNIMEKK